LGGVLGFGLNWILAERKERYELRRSIAPMRVEAYKSLWVLCEKDLKPDERTARIEALWDWYNSGGGLFLSLTASERFFSAMKLMQKVSLMEQEQKESPIEQEQKESLMKQLKDMQDNLTWLRTEMKYHVGSYTRSEKNTPIRDAS
jgi:hypothetical protein